MLATCLMFAGLTIKAQRTRVEFPVTFTKPYCGGARPDEEMQKKAETPVPYANMTLIYFDEKKKIDSVKTNAAGIFRKKLRKGNYQLFESWRYNLYTPGSKDITSFDRNCLLAEWQKPFATLRVERKQFKLVILTPITEFCEWQVPCLKDTEIPPGRQ